jgi:signal peptidase
MKRVTNWTGNIFLALTALILVLFFVMPHILGINFFTILSGSMKPAIPIGSVVVVGSIGAVDIETGDIIAYSTRDNKDKVVVHRVIEVMIDKDSLNFLTAGDANLNPDGYAIPADDVIGKVWFNMPLLGYLSHLIKTKLGFFLLIGIPGIAIISLEIRKIVNHFRSIRTRSDRQILSILTVNNLDDQQSILSSEANKSNNRPTKPDVQLTIEQNMMLRPVTAVDKKARIEAEATEIVAEILAKVRAKNKSVERPLL